MATDISVPFCFLWAGAVSWYDHRQRRVPNVALILVLVPAVLALVFQGQGLLGQRWLSSLCGLVFGLALTLPGYVLKRLGAGDVKFAAALGLLLGAARTLEMLLGASILMGISALILLAMKMPRQTKFPAAPMFAIAFVVEVARGPLLIHWQE